MGFFLRGGGSCTVLFRPPSERAARRRRAPPILRGPTARGGGGGWCVGVPAGGGAPLRGGRRGRRSTKATHPKIEKMPPAVEARPRRRAPSSGEQCAIRGQWRRLLRLRPAHPRGAKEAHETLPGTDSIPQHHAAAALPRPLFPPALRADRSRPRWPALPTRKRGQLAGADEGLAAADFRMADLLTTQNKPKRQLPPSACQHHLPARAVAGRCGRIGTCALCCCCWCCCW